MGGNNRILVRHASWLCSASCQLTVVLRLVLGAFQIQEAKSNKREAVEVIARQDELIARQDELIAFLKDQSKR